MRGRGWTLAALLLALSVPAVARAQQVAPVREAPAPAPVRPAPVRPEPVDATPAGVESARAEQIRRWETELVEVERRLAEAERETLLDPELRALNTQLGVELEAAMAEEDPGLRAALERLTALDDRASEAMERHDLVTLAQLTSAIARIEERFQEAQAAALRRPELADRVEVFHAIVRERMRLASPEAVRLLGRFAESHRLLAEVELPAEPRPDPGPDTAAVVR